MARRRNAPAEVNVEIFTSENSLERIHRALDFGCLGNALRRYGNVMSDADNDNAGTGQLLDLSLCYIESCESGGRLQGTSFRAFYFVSMTIRIVRQCSAELQFGALLRFSPPRD